LKAKELKKDIIFSATLRGFDYTFHSTWGIFSPRKIDEGTRLLINCLEIQPGDDCLDLGCGYGPIGLVMARCAPDGVTYLVDKDFVAVDYAQKNAVENGIANVHIMLSNGFSSVEKKRFSLIASNIPANVGREQLFILLSDAKAHLLRGGYIYLVTIAGLKHFIQRNLNTLFGNCKKVKQRNSYAVWQAEKRKSSSHDS
jgi:16S rRNA (guanine1207-N2)-methyltransferase